MGVWIVTFRKRNVVVAIGFVLSWALSLYIYHGKGVSLAQLLLTPVIFFFPVLLWSVRFIRIRLKFPADAQSPNNALERTRYG